MVKTEWVSIIKISETRKATMESCFSNEVEFHYSPDVDSLKSLIKTFKLRIEDITENDSNEDSFYCENKVMDCLNVMDNVSGIADSCKEFETFLTVSRKYKYHCIYVFYIIILEKNIISQTNIFNIFPCSVSFNTVSNTFQINYVPTTTKYVPVHSMWLTRIFLDHTSQDEQDYLAIECIHVN